MKKVISLLCAAVLMFGFTACEDVPAPYKLYTEGGNSETIFSETFASSLGKFANYTTDGGVSWVNSYSCATATGYDNATKVTTDGTAYLISQTIDLTNIDTLLHITYDYVLRYNRSQEYQALLITEDFVPNLGNIEEQPWKILFNEHTEGVDYNTFYQADVNVPMEFIGKKVRIAFYFKCETSSSTWEVKNFKVLKGAAGTGGDGTQHDEDAIFNAVFSSSLLPFTNYTTSGEGEWINDYSTAKATGYDNASKVTTAGTYYLVSPAISLAEVDSAYVDYSYILRYNKGNENQQLLISSSFDPNNPTAGWKVLNNNHTEGTDWATFAETEIQIPEEFIGQTIYLAFYYNTDNKSGSTWEVKSVAVRKGKVGEGGDDTIITGGTKDKPFTVSQLQALFDANKIPSQKIYVHGIVSQIKEVDTGSYGNATYYISDDGSTSGQFEIYRGYSLNGAKFTSKDQLQVGDEVIVYGTAVLYNGKTRELTQGNQLYYSSRLGKADDSGDDGGTTGGTPKGSGTASDPYNVAKLLQLFSSNNIPTNEIYFKGIVSKIKEVSPDFGNATYYVSDDGKDSNTFYVYRSKYLNNTKFTSENQLQVGDTVIVYGKVTLYINTPETEQNNSYLYWTSRTGGQGDDGGDDEGGDDGEDKPVVSSIENGGFETWVDDKTPENWKTASTAGNATLSASTDSHSGIFSVCVAGTTSANKRLGYKEINLEAGTYTMTFYAKAESNTASVRPGYVPVKSDGSVGSYVYGEYTNDISASEWVKVSHEFTIDSNTTLCLVIMNSKNPGGNVLIDDVTLTKSSNAKKRH